MQWAWTDEQWINAVAAALVLVIGAVAQLWRTVRKVRLAEDRDRQERALAAKEREHVRKDLEEARLALEHERTERHNEAKELHAYLHSRIHQQNGALQQMQTQIDLQKLREAQLVTQNAAQQAQLDRQDKELASRAEKIADLTQQVRSLTDRLRAHEISRGG